MRSFARITSAACAVAFFFTACAHAAPLAPGTSLYPVPGEADPTPGGVIASMSLPFSAAPLYSGVLTSTVVDDPGNPLGGLTFVYELSNDFVSSDAIHRLTINGYAGLSVDASYQSPTLGLLPTLVTRSLAGTIGFNFIPTPVGLGELGAGLTTAKLVVETDAPTYVLSFASVIDGTVTSVASFAPAPLIPEPSTILLFGVGAGALASYAFYPRRRRDLGRQVRFRQDIHAKHTRHRNHLESVFLRNSS